MRIFVDTGAWVSIAIKGDQHHKAAVQLLQNFQQQNVLFVTSDYIFDEVLTLVRKRSTHEKSKRIGISILKSSVVRLERITEPVWEKAWRIFQRYNDKMWSFTDCTSFALMDQLNISSAFTFDRDFEQYGKEVLP
jgi:predicted nucleic acid-binding protein